MLAITFNLYLQWKPYTSQTFLGQLKVHILSVYRWCPHFRGSLVHYCVLLSSHGVMHDVLIKGVVLTSGYMSQNSPAVLLLGTVLIFCHGLKFATVSFLFTLSHSFIVLFMHLSMYCPTYHPTGKRWGFDRV